MFIDFTKVELHSGKGGAGAVSFRREKYVPKGGPDGGDGGRGGSIIFRVDHNLHTLQDIKYRRFYKAENGQQGGSSRKTGKDGADIYIPVPPGTIIKNTGSKEGLADLTEDRDSFIASHGGRGGKGNEHYKSSTRQAPRYAQPGLPGEKGIFSLTKILNEISIDFEFSIVGGGDTHKLDKQYLENKKFVFYPFQNEINSLIKFYDNHNITILPSFTEAYPKVVDESLSRLRPVIVFEEINHIIQDRQGLFVSKRNAAALSETIKFIMSNYTNIQESMKKNILPTKQKFISQITRILH